MNIVNLEVEIMRSLKDDPLFDLGFMIFTKGSDTQREIAQAAISLEQAGKIHLQQRAYGEYLVSLDEPALINRKIASYQAQYEGKRIYTKAGQLIPHTPSRYSKPARQAKVVEFEREMVTNDA